MSLFSAESAANDLRNRFVTLRPFEDRNGRIARSIGDLLLTRADGSPERFLSLSAEIQRDRQAYYQMPSIWSPAACFAL